jgi:glycyl-tRNA synthetase
MPATNLEQVVSLAKRRGFIFPGSDIYGGLGGFYDFGPLGTELKFNIKQAWWNDVVRMRDDVVGLNASIIMNPKVWEASGHVGGFSDPMVECKKCHQRFRADQMEDACPNCGGKEFSDVRQFNLMFKTNVGPAEDTASVAYLRPETAGGIFINFKNVLDTMRVRVPFGIAQIGKAFRNEVNPKDYIFRTREFEQMELEYFVKPGEDDQAFQAWIDERFAWYQKIGLKKVRKTEQPKEELAHYSKGTTDIEYEFPFGWKEIEGVANRTDFDLKAHAAGSGQDLSYTDPDTNEKFVPYVIEPSAGVDRITLAVLCEAYTEEDERVVLKLHPRLAPYKVAVFPLLKNKPELVEKARGIYNELKKHFNVAWDDRGNIGKRYFAQDEIGTPFCVTVDFETIENGDETVTIRHRDSMKQERIKIADLKSFIEQSLS